MISKFKNKNYKALLKIIFAQINFEDLSTEQFEGFKKLSQLDENETDFIECISDFFFDYF